jgi:hypothetical protein
MKSFFNNRDQHIGGQRNPNLRLHRVLARAVKRLDSEMLLDPFEEEFHLPTALVERRNGCGWQVHVVRQKRDAIAVLVPNPHAANRLRIRLGCLIQRQDADLIEHHAGVDFVHAARVAPPELGIAFCSRHKESARCVHGVQPCEIQIPAIHQIESSRLDRQRVQSVHLVHLPVADMNKAGDVAPQVQQGMQLDGSLGFAKRSPRMQGQTQVDRGRVQRVDHGIQIHAKRIVCVERASYANQGLTQVGIDLPRARCVCVGKRVAGNGGAAKAHVIQASGLSAKVDLDVSQALAVGQLGEGHCKELIQALEVFDLVVASPARDAAREGGQGQVRHELRKNEFALMHELPRRSKAAKRDLSWIRRSNRHQTKSSIYANNSLTYLTPMCERWDTTGHK